MANAIAGMVSISSRSSLSLRRTASSARHFVWWYIALAPGRVVVVGKSGRRFSAPENCVDLTNQTTLLQLVWLLRAAAFVISVDSGPMHVAAAVTPNLVSIHTWTDPRRVGPYNNAATIWKNGKLFRVADLESTTDLRKGRKFLPKDVGPVADLALSALAKQPLA